MTAITAGVAHVRSADGTSIGYTTTGSGPPLVLVHGTTASHTTWQRLQPHLQDRHTLHAMDRRGRGLSGDAPAYALEREYDDVVGPDGARAAHRTTGPDRDAARRG